MSKKIERLRAVYLNKDSQEQITNLESLGDFSKDDFFLLEEFKKIYYIGVDQLDYFVNQLDRVGDYLNVDLATVIYYMDQLRCGPLAGYLPAAQQKTPITLRTKWWTNAPEVIGVIKYLYKSTVQTPIPELKTTEVIDMIPLLLNKCPQHIVDQYTKISKLTNSVYADNIGDNLKLDDKLREVPEGIQPSNKTPHGSYLVADTTLYPVLESVQEAIEQKIQLGLKFPVKETIQDRYTNRPELRTELTYTLYLYRRDFNYFKETDTSSKYVINRLSEYKDGNAEKKVIIPTDLVGNTFDSDNVRRFGTLSVINEDKNTTLNLHTVRGQLGDISEPKRDPLIQKET